MMPLSRSGAQAPARPDTGADPSRREKIRILRQAIRILEEQAGNERENADDNRKKADEIAKARDMFSKAAGQVQAKERELQEAQARLREAAAHLGKLTRPPANPFMRGMPRAAGPNLARGALASSVEHLRSRQGSGIMAVPLAGMVGRSGGVAIRSSDPERARFGIVEMPGVERSRTAGATAMSGGTAATSPECQASDLDRKLDRILNELEEVRRELRNGRARPSISPSRR